MLILHVQLPCMLGHAWERTTVVHSKRLLNTEAHNLMKVEGLDFVWYLCNSLFLLKFEFLYYFCCV